MSRIFCIQVYILKGMRFLILEKNEKKLVITDPYYTVLFKL